MPFTVTSLGSFDPDPYSNLRSIEPGSASKGVNDTTGAIDGE
jgi:hypothetical protein